MKKYLTSFFVCGLLLFYLLTLSSCVSSNGSDSSSAYELGYELGYEDGYELGYAEGIAELEIFKESNMLVPYLLEELICEEKIDAVREILSSDIDIELLLGEYIGDSSNMLLHKSSCEDIRYISYHNWVFYCDRGYAALDIGYTRHDCIDDLFTDEEIAELFSD